MNGRFDGNLRQASQEIGCDYGQLWRTVRGFYRKQPPLGLLRKLSQFTTIPVDTWIEGSPRTDSGDPHE